MRCSGRFKAQTEAVTIVLISGIIIALTGTVYLWGKPLMEKRAVISQFQSSIDFMKGLNDKIEDMIKTCRTPNACEVSMDAPISGLIYLDEANNSIVYEYPIAQNVIGGEEEVPLSTVNVDEVAGVGDKPGVVFLSSVKKGGTFLIRLRVWYRTLYDEDAGKYIKVRLKGEGSNSGNRKVTARYGGSSISGNTLIHEVYVTLA